MSGRWRIGLATLLLAAVGRAQVEVPKVVATAPERVEAFRAAREIPGIGVAIRGADGAIDAFGVGVADLENEIPVTDATVFRLASISKSFTAVTMLRLVERGEFDLDQPVDRVVPSWPKKQWPLTSRHLLGHLGGVRHYRGVEMDSNVHYASVTDALAIFADDPLLHEPGTRYAYTTYGYNLLGAAIEATTKQAFDAVLTREVLEPAGCRTLVVDDVGALVPHRAQGYHRVGARLENSRPVDTSNKVPGGGLCGTPSDLVRFGGALLDGTLLKPATRDRMWTSMTTADGNATGYGMGFAVREGADGRFAWHTGAQPRVSTVLFIDRDRQICVALMANLEGEGNRLRELAQELARDTVHKR